MKGKRKAKGGKKAYEKRANQQKKRAKQETSEDINQNYEIKNLKKKVGDLMKGTKSFSLSAGDSTTVPTVIGQTNQSLLSGFLINNISDLQSATLEPGVNTGPNVSMQHIGLNYSLNTDVESSAEDAGTSYYCRVMMIVIHEPAGDPNVQATTYPQIADILFLPQNAVHNLTSHDVLAHYARLGRQNFEVLYDKTHVMSPMIAPLSGDTEGAMTGGLPYSQVHLVNVVPTKRSKQMQFSGDEQASPPTALANQAQNQYLLLAFSDNPVAGNAQPITITWNLVTDFIQ